MPNQNPMGTFCPSDKGQGEKAAGPLASVIPAPLLWSWFNVTTVKYFKY